MIAWITSISLLTAALAVHGQPPPILVGVTVSQTGAHAELAADYLKALLLWQDEANAAGGLLGRRVELRPLDDRSDAATAGKLYGQLIREDRVDLLIGPYGSAATLMAAAEAERAQRVIVNGTGAARALHRRARRYVFQSAAPNAAYGAGVLELARQEGLERLFIVARDDPASREMGDAARDAASGKGFSVGELELYRAGTVDFAVLVTKAIEGGADGWIAFGEAREAAEMVRSFKRTGYAPRLFFARGAADPKFIPLVGRDAELSLGVREYDARFPTPGNGRFVREFTARWSAPPGTAAAQGYAAATVLAAAVRRAASLDQEKLRAALAALETGTVLGAYKVDPRTGGQTALKPAVVQVQNGRPEVVWPGAVKTAEHRSRK